MPNAPRPPGQGDHFPWLAMLVLFFCTAIGYGIFEGIYKNISPQGDARTISTIFGVLFTLFTLIGFIWFIHHPIAWVKSLGVKMLASASVGFALGSWTLGSLDAAIFPAVAMAFWPISWRHAKSWFAADQPSDPDRQEPSHSQEASFDGSFAFDPDRFRTAEYEDAPQDWDTLEEKLWAMAQDPNASEEERQTAMKKLRDRRKSAPRRLPPPSRK